jgi:hypothetical protein
MAIYKGNFPIEFTGGVFKEDIKNNLLFLGNTLVYGSLLPAPPAPTFISASGGTITTDGDFKIHSFTTVGSSSFIASQISNTPAFNDIEVLVVGGGGAGGNDIGGGGGGGQVQFEELTLTATGTSSVVVGAGGITGSTVSGCGLSGSSSVFSTVTSIGGGGGFGRTGNGDAPNDGFNGGGGSYDFLTGNAGIGGNAGGNTVGGASDRGGGGGGGAGGAGVNGTNIKAGDGGVGTANSITGTSVNYAGGGGGAYYQQTTVGDKKGLGVDGGGNAGTELPPLQTNNRGQAGLANRGGGGGAGGPSGAGGNPTGGLGGSGVVIVRYKFQ